MESKSQKQNDGWTSWAAYCEVGTKFVSTGYSLGETVDLVASELLDAQKVALGLSVPGLIIGVMIGGFAAAGTAYVHKKRNSNNQPPDEHKNCCAHNHDNVDHHDTAHDHYSDHTGHTTLSTEQEIAYIGDIVSHASAFSSSFTFLFNLITASPTTGLKIIVQFLAIIVGATATVSDVRSCKKNLLSGNTHNGCNHSHNGEADNWNNWTTIVDVCSETTSTFYWAADIIDSVANLILVELLGASKLSIIFLTFSWPALIIGAVTGIIALGAVYSHRILAIHDDGNPNNKPDKNISLTNTQRFSLFGDAIAHTTEVAAPLNFVYELATKSTEMPCWVKPAFQCVATFFGASAAVADVRTCENSMLKQNAASQGKEDIGNIPQETTESSLTC